MKVIDIICKIRLTDTEVTIKENFNTLKQIKLPLNNNEWNYLNRTVVSIQPTGVNKLEINIKPIE